MTDSAPTVRVTSLEEADRELDEIANIIDSACVQKKSVSKEDLNAAVINLEAIASDYGLSTDILRDMLNFTCIRGFLDQGTTIRIIKAMYPRHKIEAEAVGKVVGCLGLGQNKPSPPTQAALLRWLIMVYDLLEDHRFLLNFYDLLFSLLDMITIRPLLCHILSILTQRKHVKPFRIQQLLELRNQVGPEPALLGLLLVYKNYYPDVIVGEVGKVRAGLFAHPKPDWLGKVKAIQRRYGDVDDRERSSFRISRKFGDEGVKRRKTGHVALPRSVTAGAHETSVTIEEIQNAEDLATKFYKLELPSQLASAIQDPLLRKVIDLRQSDKFSSRIDNWLSACLFEELSTTGKVVSESENADTALLLESLLQYTEYTKNLLPSIQTFLREALKTWDGRVYQTSILGLISFASLDNYHDLYESYLSPLDKLLSGSQRNDQTFALRLLTTYTHLLQTWILQHPPSTPIPDEQLLSNSLVNFQRQSGALSLRLLSAHDTTTTIPDAILRLYETLSTAATSHPLFRLVLLPDSLIYRLLFSPDPMTLSRTCGVLDRYREVFSASRATPDSDAGDYPRETLDHFNGFLMDTCNCLMRNRALTRQDQNARACNIPESVVTLLQSTAAARNTPLSTTFYLTHSSVLTGIAAKVFREKVGRPAGAPVSQKSLRALAQNGGPNVEFKEFRAWVFDECRRVGYTGLPDLMYNIMM